MNNHADGNLIATQFIKGLTWDALPAGVQDKVKLCLLDVLGATLSGTLTRVSQLTTAYAQHAYQGSEASILLHGIQATAAGAAFANGYAANGLDSDDSARYTKGHPGSQIFPAGLAIAERDGLSGKDLLTAMVVGYEIAHRVGRCWHDHHAIYQACGSWGSVASAATVAHLMRLDEATILHALGIAEYHAPNLPMMRDIDNPAMVKHGIGWGAMTGVTAAELAAAGFTGIPSILGFEQYYDWVADLGQNYIMVDGVSFKEFAACSWSHSAILGARKIREEVDYKPEDIEHILVEGYHETLRLGNKLPKTTEEAQFNTAWPLAAYIVDGEVGPSQTLERRLTDEQIISIANKVELVEDRELSELAARLLEGDTSGTWANRVTIHLKDGRKLESGLIELTGLGDDVGTLIDKFHWLVSHVLPTNTVKALIEITLNLDQVDEMDELLTLIRKR